MILQDNCSSSNLSDFSFLLSYSQKMEILQTDFGIKTREIEDMTTYDDYRDGESRREGFRESIREGRDETILQIYINMKKNNIKDEYVCSLIGISMYKLRKIKMMNKETAISRDQLL